MKNIKVQDRSIHVLLSGSFYGVDYYQREYKWGRKQLQDLVEDLTGRFLDSYQTGDSPGKVAGYGSYFLGSIVVSRQNEASLLVDGQQRICSILLLLIYLNNLQKGRDDYVNIEQLIFADNYGDKKFRLNVPDHHECLTALFEGKAFNSDGCSVSVQNMVDRYNDLDELLSDELRGNALNLFIYWFTQKVNIIEILAFEDEDAYTIFQTMNDRGLSLSPVDMLKGYLLANIDDDRKRSDADKTMKDCLIRLSVRNEKTESDFFKVWLRSQYATKVREQKRSSSPEDFDLIGTEYPRWVHKKSKNIGLRGGDDFHQIIKRDIKYYVNMYLKLLDATDNLTEGLESIRYNADAGFTLQHHLMLAAIAPGDDEETAVAKAGVVADFLDIWLNLRFWNGKSNNYSNVKQTIFRFIKGIRRKPLEDLREVLCNYLSENFKKLDFSPNYHLGQRNSKIVHQQLARFTDWLERQSGESGNYQNYNVRSGKTAYEIEHIWANRYERFTEEFNHRSDFEKSRNQIGGLLLMPKKVNASLGDKTYEDKRLSYLGGNALAKSLHEGAYQNNPGFLQTIDKFKLPFKSHVEFTKKDMEERSELYCRLAEVIWSPDRLLDGDTS